MRRVLFSSIPFMVVGFLILVVSIIQQFSNIGYLASLSYGILALYAVVLGYFYIFNNRKQSSIQQNFLTPYHKRKLELDENNLILIREGLDHKLI